jgi:hypothetical protein
MDTKAGKLTSISTWNVSMKDVSAGFTRQNRPNSAIIEDVDQHCNFRKQAMTKPVTSDPLRQCM